MGCCQGQPGAERSGAASRSCGSSRPHASSCDVLFDLIATPPALSPLQARNKPIEPPKKPAAAPFFLPTLAGVDAGRNPVFDFGAADGQQGGEGGAADPAAEAALAARAAAAWGDGEDEAEEGGSEGGSDAEGEEGRAQDGAADAAGSGAQRRRPPAGRVLKTGAAAEHSQLVRLLHACARAGDWASLVAHLRALPPVQVDAEIRAMQVRACLGRCMQGPYSCCSWRCVLGVRLNRRAPEVPFKFPPTPRLLLCLPGAGGRPPGGSGAPGPAAAVPGGGDGRAPQL